MSKFDRTKTWGRTRKAKQDRAFVNGYNQVMNSWHWEDIQYPDPIINAYDKGVIAGINKRKEIKLERLLSGKSENIVDSIMNHKTFTFAELIDHYDTQYKVFYEKHK